MEFTLYLFATHSLLWICVSLLLYFDKYTENNKKVLQILLALLVPLLGPIIVAIVQIGLRMKATHLSDREIGQSIRESPVPFE